jgi:hypothetical protein
MGRDVAAPNDGERSSVLLRLGGLRFLGRASCVGRPAQRKVCKAKVSLWFRAVAQSSAMYHCRGTDKIGYPRHLNFHIN